MRILYGVRANAILYNWLKSNNISGSVIVPANICDTVVAMYRKAGCRVVLCDIEPRTWQPDRERILELLKKDGSIAILHYSHTYGYEGDFEDGFFQLIAGKYPSLIIIDDRCLCRPFVKNIDESFSTMTLFSTGGKKVADLGGGAYALLNERCTLTRYFHHALPYSEEEEERFETENKRCLAQGTRLSEEVILSGWLNTGIGSLPPDYLDRVERYCGEIMPYKASMNRIYEGLPGSMGTEYNVWRYNILAANREECLTKLFQEGLFASAHYSNVGGRFAVEGDMHWCEWLHSHVINLFNDYAYSPEQARKTREILQGMIEPIS